MAIGTSNNRAVNFFTPINYSKDSQKTVSHHFKEGIENFFFLGNEVAYPIPGKMNGNSQAVYLSNRSKSPWNTPIDALKLLSYTATIYNLLRLLSQKLSMQKKLALKNSAFSTALSKTSRLATAITLIAFASKLFLRTKHKFHLDLQTSGSSDLASSTVKNLIENATTAWVEHANTFEFSIPLDPAEFSKTLKAHTEKFKCELVDYEKHFGYIEKVDLAPETNPRIYMRADLHGDLKSLIENLRSLQEQGLLDENYKCKEGVHLVFLGDYCDRGNYGVRILEIFMQLREENPRQIHLIRGNHESTVINAQYGASDQDLMDLVLNKEGSEALEGFYRTMSLTTYFSIACEGKREYIQCTHGLFEPSVDPSEMLDLDQPKAEKGRDFRVQAPVLRERKLSDRVSLLAQTDSPLKESAERVKEIVEATQRGIPISDWTLTLYNWGDVASESFSSFSSPGARCYNMCAKDIKHCLDISSVYSKVMMIFRGHEHQFQHLLHEGRVLVTTLPVGTDSPGYLRYSQDDRAYIISPRAKVEEWTKQAILRKRGSRCTTSLSAPIALTAVEGV